MNSLNVVFMGTPEFAVPTLLAIQSSNHNIVGIVTQPDRARGRGRKVSYTAVKQAATNLGLEPILQPEKMKDPAFVAQLESLNADIFVVVAYRILPEIVFAMPKLGTINLHPSALPKFRGAAPINWTIIKGEERTAITTIAIQKEIDAGNIVLQKSMPVYPDDTAGSLHDRLASAGATQVVEALDLFASDDVVLSKQDHSLATPAPKLTKETCHLSFDQPATQVKNWIHGLSPYPGAYVFYSDNQLKLFRAEVVSHSQTHHQPGEVIRAADGVIEIACASGTIAVTELQLQGRKRMAVADFLRGTDLEAGVVLQ